MQAEYLSRDGANGEESIGDWGALEAPRGRRDGRSAGGEEEDGEERRGGICSGEGARVMRPPLPRSGGWGGGEHVQRGGRPPATGASGTRP
jgi:hypothetical protein